MIPELPIDRFEVFATGLDHPECVAFDREGCLWAGGEAGQVYCIDRAGKVETIASLGGFTGGLAFSPNHELFVCNPSLGIVRVRRDGKHEVFAADAARQPLVTPNFPAFDRAGNLYVTDSGNWKKRNGYLLRFDWTGNGIPVAGPFGYANGLALSADESRLFMVESDTNRVLVLDTEHFQTTVYAEQVGRLPDGLALDEAGNLYVSCYASDDIQRVAPDGKKTLFAHDPFAILLSRPTNMAFDGEWMYIANLGRTTITRAKVPVRGQKLVNSKFQIAADERR
ncbi:MAG TPA: SMP-30/gluconolactonase/LRE family protein [Tepidisphaeraceae bacterium]|nr:SMP-30/gluconolactonase/LRE family protein [Tepidisphaeraceae bacterium]